MFYNINGFYPKFSSSNFDGSSGANSSIENALYPAYLSSIPDPDSTLYYRATLSDAYYCLGAELETITDHSSTVAPCINTQNISIQNDIADVSKIYAVGNAITSSGS